MHIGLLIPAERNFCPYLKNFTSILDECSIDYLVVQWDRLSSTEGIDFTYKDGKPSDRKNFFEYICYAKFIKKLVHENNISQFIIFGLPLLMALKYIGALKNINYAVDVRDYHKSFHFPGVKNALDYANFVSISSPGFETWLKTRAEILISHNAINLLKSDLECAPSQVNLGSPVNIGTIGALKDLPVNKLILENFANHPEFHFLYDGLGNINQELKDFCKKKEISNISFSGYYHPDDENQLYKRCDYISMFMTLGGKNNNTLMSNRFYNAVLYGVPMLTLAGSYLSQQMRNYNLGLVFSSIENFRSEFNAERAKFDLQAYECGRIKFLEAIRSDHLKFTSRLKSILESHI